MTRTYSLISLNNAKNLLPQHSKKPHSFYQFSSKHVSGWCQKKHLHYTISKSQRTAFSKHLESKSLYIRVYLRKKIFFQWRRMLLSGGGLNNFLKADHCLKCFKILHFNLNFLVIQLFVSIFILPFTALKRWNFPNNLDFKGKTVAKFLIRSHFLSIYSNVTNKQKINHGAMQKVCHLHNDIFHLIHQCLTLSV